MNRRISKRYTLLISCTGRKPIALSFHPGIVFLALVFGLGLPIATLGTTLYSYAHHNFQLTQRNSQLTQEASNILKRVEALETKIKMLKDRQVSPVEGKQVQPSSRGPQASLTVEPEAMLSVARDKIPNLVQLLQRKTELISEQTLLRDAARPKGMPVPKNSQLSSSFGLRPSSYGWGYELHQGIDFSAAYGSPVYATAPGKVEKAGWDAGFGNRIVIDHGYGYQTLYAHLFKLVVVEGSLIDRNQVIGYLGDTGQARLPHLHYGVYRNGYGVDPKDYLN
jgi:murein DD-endopeptidase MepM/ murein hydrolase activator NlpD